MLDRTKQHLSVENELNPTILPDLSPFFLPALSSGIFAVGETGEVSFDLLFEKKRVKGDLGLFRLQGIESLAVESEDFIREVIRRTASNSDLGRLIFSDRAIENNTNSNIGTETLTMNPGETFALVFFPDGIETAIAHHIPPILSLTAGKFANVGDGQTVAIEVVENGAIDSLTGQLDRPYTDLIFRVEGATGQLEKLDIFITSEQDWRETSFGQKILISDVSVAIQEENIFAAEEIKIQTSNLFTSEALEVNSSQESQVLNRLRTNDFEEENIETIKSDLSQPEQIGEEIEIVQSSLIQLKQTEEKIEIETIQSDSSQLKQVQKNPSDPFTSGVFTVGESGEIGFDFLFDGGKYKSELAIFSLEGMGEYEFSSTEFIEEATKRALSNSKLGYVVIQDRTEGAKFDGELGEKSWNQGEYKGVKTFQMETGTRFGVMLIPDGTVKKANKNPKIGGAKKPLFSMALAGKDFGQIADLNGEGHTFAMEDVQPNHKWFDRDYNDIIFQVKGATGTAQSFDNAINPEKDWRQTELGQEILDYIKSPELAPQDLKLIIDGLYNPGESLAFSGLVTDKEGGASLDRVELFLQKDGGEWVKIEDATEFTRDRYTPDAFKFKSDLGVLEPGKYNLQGIAYDNSNGTWELETEVFTVLSVPEGKELSDRVKVAIQQATNLHNYDPEALIQTKEWVVSVRSGVSANELADVLGATNLGATGRIPNTYRWEIPQNSDPFAIAKALRSQIGIEFAYPLVPLEITFGSEPTDEPLTKKPDNPQQSDRYQWHLQSGSHPTHANISEAWEVEIADPNNPNQMKAVRGDGVTIGFVDDGFAIADSEKGLDAHWDLKDNYRPDLSWDFDEEDATPSTRVYATIESEDEASILSDMTTQYELPRMNLSGTIEKLTVNFEIDYNGEEDLNIYLLRPYKSQREDIFNQPDDPNDPIKIQLLSGVGGGSYSLVVPDFNGKAPKYSYSNQWTLEINNRGDFGGLLESWSLEFETLNRHGTSVAGVAIADGSNDRGGSGVAPGAEWAGLRINSGKNLLTDSVVEEALGWQQDNIHIYSNSWGPQFFSTILGGTFELEDAIAEGRDGLGSIYVFAAGNNAKNGGNVNYNYLANARQSIAVGAMDFTGKRSTYSEKGAALFIVSPSSTSKYDPNFVGITTTDVDGQYRHDFGGTSSATPFVSGVVALMLEANPNLTWRDVQHILAETADREGIDTDWTGEEGDRLRHSHEYGFGAIDAEAAVQAAIDWVSVGEEILLSKKEGVGARIPEYDPNGVGLSSAIEFGDGEANIELEWVEVIFKGNHQYIGELRIALEHVWVDEEGEEQVTQSILSEFHTSNNYNGERHNSHKWAFSSVRHWGESSQGTWKLWVRDMRDHPDTKHNEESEDKSDYNEWTNWKINLYGTEFNTPPEASPLNQSHNYTEDEVLKLKPIIVADADGDEITAVLHLSDAGAGELRSGHVVSNDGILQVSGSVAEINNILAQVEFVPTEHFNGNLVVETAVTDGKIGVPLTGEIALTGTPVNDAPMLDEVALSGAIAGQPITITHADLLAASNATDVEGDAIAFIIEALNSGTLTQDGEAIALGIQISAGDVLEWTPEGSGDDISAFSIKATDGIDASVNAIDVTVDVADSYTPVKIGDEFAINTHTEKGQWGASVTGLDDGGFVVTWTSWEQDGVQGGIYGQRHDRDGNKVGGEFQINTTTVQMQTAANVTTLQDGTFIVTWHSYLQDGSDEAIIGRRYDSQGNPLTNEFQINTRTEFDQETPNIEAFTDGGFVVVWSTDEDGNNGYAIYGQRYNSAGVKVGDEFRANTYNENEQITPRVAVLQDDSFVVTWWSKEQDGTKGGVYAQRYGSDGNPTGQEFRVNTETIYSENDPAIATLENGSFVIAWTSGLPGQGIFNGIRGQLYDTEGNEIAGELQLSDVSTGQYTRWPKLTSLQDGGFMTTWESWSDSEVYGQRFNANGTAIGEQFRVNDYTDGVQNGGEMATLKDGRFVVTWASEGQDGDDMGVYGRIFEVVPESKAVSGEVQVNTYTESSQSRPEMATLADGSYVVTWQSYGQDSSAWGVFAQRYDTLGNTLGQEFQINTETSSYQEHPSIAALQDGGFIVAWESLNQDGDRKGIFAQRFNGTGAKIAGEFQVNSESTGEQLYPAIASLNNGDFVITWQSEGQDGSNFGIFGQRYDSQGNALGNEFQINTATTNDQNRPSISSLQDGGFLVTWASDGQDGSHEGIYGQRYNASGEKVSSEFNINTYSNGTQYVPTVTSLADGGFAIAWQSEGQDGSAYGIYGQRFNSNSQPVGEEFRINTEVSQHQVNPAIAQLSNGGFVVTWQSFYQDGSHYDIYGQRFDSTGNAVGDEFPINTTTLSRQMMPSVTPLDNDTFVVAWQSYVQDGDGYAIVSRIFSNEPETTTTENFAPQLSAITLSPPHHGHQGSTDPTTERWMLSLKDGNTVGAVNDNGIEAWSTNDDLTTTGGAYYYRTLSRGESIIADTYGWKLSANLKIIELNDSPAGSIITSYRNGFDGYQLHWGSNADGDVMLRVLTDENGYETHTLTGVSANEYRDYDLIFDPDTKMVKVLVDGVEKISNYGGYNASGSNEHAPTNRQQIFWGAVSSSDTGEAYWQKVNFETLKPKAMQGHAYTMTYEELLAASDATDANGDDLSFIITSLKDGTLTKNGQAVIAGTTQISKGETLIWTPESGGKTVTGFEVKATDGKATSTTPVSVTLDVAEIPKGKIGKEFKIDSQSAKSKVRPSVTSLQDGSFIATWQSHRYNASNANFGQRYDASGKPIGKEFQINAHTSRIRSAVSTLDDGGFIVTWQSEWGGDGSIFGIFAQRYDADSNPIGEEFRVNTHTVYGQETPAIATLSNGEYVIIWQSFDQDGSGQGIYGQRFDRNHKPLGTEFALNTQTKGHQRYPDITALKTGGFVATWTSESQDGNYDIYARRYDANGNAIGKEFLVNTHRSNSQYAPTIATLQDGSFVISWHSMGQDDNSTSGIYGQRYNSNGDRIGTEFKINTISQSDQLNPAIAPLSNGGFVVTWQSKGYTVGIQGQRYDRNGDRLGGEFRINPEFYGLQIVPAVAGLPDGKFVTLWQSIENDIWDIHGQILGNDPEAESSGNITPELSLIHLDPVNASHVGSTDPATEGWKELGGSQNTIGPVDDGGVKAWHIKDTFTGFDPAGYNRPMYFAEAHLASIYGWKITVDLKLGEQVGHPNGAVKVIYHSGETGYQIQWGANSEGDLLLQYAPEDYYITHTLEGVAANEYHLTEMIFDPKTNTAKILVDGKEIVSNYTGHTASSGAAEILRGSYFFWGSGWGGGKGETYWKNATFEVLKPKAIQGKPHEITYEELLAASDAKDANGDDLSFIITSLKDGTLTKNGQAVIAGTTQISKGEKLVWTPKTAGDKIAGFAVKATDGKLLSENAVDVAITVSPPANTAPELNKITALAGATATQPYEITYNQLLQASDAKDAEGDALSFRIESLLSGTLTKNGTTAKVGDIITSTDKLAWTTDKTGDALSAFSVKAYDGQSYSENSAIVPITVDSLPSQEVTVTVHRIAEVDNIDWSDLRGGADFRTVININGIGWTSPIQDDGNDISPNWQFSQDVTGATIPISIQVEDDDSYDLGLFTIEDFEQVDVNPLSGNILNLTYNLLTGEVTGSGVNGVAGEQIQVRGGGGDANRADLWFSIDAVTHPYKIGGEFQVNSQTENDQTYPAIAALKNGGFVIVWPSQNGSDWDIYGQRYDSNSNKIGGEFLVNSNTLSLQQGTDIVGLENGGFIVTWQSFNTNSNDWDIYGQRYNSNSDRIGDEFLVNTNTLDQQRNQAITALKNGGFVITWESGGLNADYEILGQIYNENGIKIGSEFTANSHAQNDQWESNITALKDGGFVITWESQNQDGSLEGVYGQRYDNNGDRVGDEFRVNSHVLDRQETADLTALEDGGFIIAWESNNQDGNSYGIYAQRYNSNGDKVGGEFQVNSHTNQAQRNPSVASLQDGGYLIAWTSQGQDGSGEGIYAQRYDNNGNTIGSEMQVNSHTLDSQSTPDLVTLTDGSVIIAWDSQNQDGSDRGIFAQRFGVAPATPQAPQLAPPSPSVFHHLNQAYNSVQDSPLPEGASLAPLRVETFEDGALDTLGVTASAGSVVSGTPHSIEDNGSSWQVEQDNLTFSFDADLLGTLPTRAGVAVTDIANADIGTVAMEIFDSQGISLGVTQPEELGSGDRFFGVEYEGGISKVTFTANSNDWNIDHLQYG